MNKQLCSGYDTSKFSPLCKPFTESTVNEELVKWASAAVVIVKLEKLWI